MSTYVYTPLDRCPMCASPSQKVLGRRLNRRQGLRPTKLGGVATTIVQCGDCGLIFANPQPLPASLGDHYDKPPETYWEPDYFAGQSDEFDYYESVMRKHMPTVANPRCLDVGAGIGYMMRTMLDRGMDAYGIEPSPAFVERAIEEGVPAERLQIASAEDAEFDEQSFDFISFGSVLEHVPDPAVALERALVWLRPGGLLFIDVPSARWLIARGLNVVYRLQGLDYVTNLSPMHNPYHLTEFTLEAFQAHGRRAGYRVAHHDYAVCNPFVPKPLDKLARWTMSRTNTGMEIMVWLTPA
jgi:SAM-dependent methyltransferase